MVPNGPQSTRKEYLTYFIDFPTPPHFAVLLNGPWGIGKTFLVKEFMKPFAARGLRCVHLSLYGLNTFDEIDDALFRAMYPLLNSKGVEFAGRAAKALGKYFRVDLDVQAKDFLDKANADVFVFDDLERCSLPTNRVLGYINEFVEHDDRKAIIIANEKEIRSDQDYSRIREKLIGKTLEIQSAFEQALEAFLGSIHDDRAKAFLRSKIHVLGSVYDQSEFNNLRVLQQSMWDFERFYVSVEDKHRNNDVAMESLLRLLLALSFELKAGRLTPVGLLKRHSAILGSMIRSRKEEGAPDQIAIAQKRYPDADLGSTALSDTSLENLLVKGIIVADQIRNELDASSFFVTVADEAAWRTVWHTFERADVEVETAIVEMEREFAAREITIPGEILQVFGLRVWLSKIGAIPKSLKDVVSEGRAYVDHLYASRRLEPSSRDDTSLDVMFGAYAGLGIYENSSPEYQELNTYLRERRDAAAVDRYPAISSDLLIDLKSDPNVFFRRLNITRDGPNDLHDIPVLASIDPRKFVAELMDHHPSSQRTALLALKSRYEHGNIVRDLSKERSWAIEVRNQLFDAAESRPPIARNRIQQLLRSTLDEVLGLSQPDRSNG